jgi:hypothetical protein
LWRLAESEATSGFAARIKKIAAEASAGQLAGYTKLLLERASRTRAISHFMIAARGCILHDGHTSAAYERSLCV